MFSTIILGVLLNALHSVKAQDDRAVDPNNHFLYPPLPGAQHTKDPTVFWNNINVTYGVSQTQPFKWISDMTSMRVTLQQEGQAGTALFREISSCSPGSFNMIYWDGRIDPIDINNGSQAYLAAWNCSQPDATPIFFSHYFNLTQAVSSTSSIITTSISSSAILPITTVDSRQTSSPISTPTLSTTASSSLPASTFSSSSSNITQSNNAAVIGGGVGGGIGGALLIVAAGIVLWKHQKKNGEGQGANIDQFLREAPPNSSAFENRNSMGPSPAYDGQRTDKPITYYGPSELA